MPKSKRILVCPLDWGLGHATRCIPVIRELLCRGAEVVVAAGGRPGLLLKEEFPGIRHLPFPGYSVSYPRRGGLSLKMILAVPGILAGIKKEHAQLKQIIASHGIGAVISDNRYGLWSEEIPSVFITHQVHIRSLLFSKALYRLNAGYINRYGECWAPDAAGDDNFSGDLSHGKPLPGNVHYIGLLSRFAGASPEEPGTSGVPRYDITAVLSGPEPQRSVFEELAVRALTQSGRRCLVVRGVTEERERRREGETDIVSHLDAPEMLNALRASDVILSRPGYSTIMDLAALGKKAIFVPTPGQTEQEYLAEYHDRKKHCPCMNQEDFDLGNALQSLPAYSGLHGRADGWALGERVERLVGRMG